MPNRCHGGHQALENPVITGFFRPLKSFELDKKASGGLADTYDFDAPAKSISEGDTSVTFALADSGSFEEQFDAMLDKMVHPDEELIAAFRRLVW